MTDTAPETLSRPKITLKPAHNMHHTAYRCRDAEQTRWFYEDVLGFKLAAAMTFDEEPGRTEKREYMHLFFQTPDGNFIAFFDAPDDVEEKMFIARHGFDQHIAFEVDSLEQLKAWRRHINKMGRPCFGPVDHGFLHSIYMYDPNGLQVELTLKDGNYQQILEKDAAVARDELAKWTEKTRSQKLARLSEDALDQRGIDMAKADFSKVKLTETSHVRD